MFSYLKARKDEILEERVPGRYFYTNKKIINSLQLFFALFSLTFGVIALVTYNNMFEIRLPYDNKTRSVSFNIEKNIKELYFYIQLKNYNQNSLLYYKSISYDQLDGYKTVDGCYPLESMGDKPIYPCGIVANTFFQDKFMLFKNNKGDLEEVKISTDDISYRACRDRVKDTEYRVDEVVSPPLWDNYTEIPDLKNNNRFINWISISGYSTFRKLYGRIKDVEAGEYILEIDPKFEGEKAVYFAESGYLGLKNNFLGCFLLVIGTMGILTVLV